MPVDEVTVAFADRWDDILSDKLTPNDIPEEFSFSVCLGDHKKELDNASLLDFLWGGGLDTCCLVCDSEFTNEDPPIRTVSLGAVLSQGEDFYISLRVVNRHMKCLRQEDLQYIPISHVWHSSVATAHDNRKPSAEAARDVRITVVKVLLATVYWEDKNIEIWHDYFSIPQWQHDIQQRLLLELPHIYAYPPYIIVHQHDADPLCYADLLDEHQRSDEQLVRAIIKPAACRWFSRMWVVLEYAVSQRAYIFMENWGLHAKPLNFLLDKIVDLVLNITDDFVPGEKTSADDHLAFRSMARWGGLATSGSPNCMGSAFAALSQSSCREHRDRFLAAYGLLYWNTDSGAASAKVPSDQIEACLWLSLKRLEAGDYTPLLLEPSKYETSVQPNWLRGHTNISPYTWFAGNQISPPLQPVIVRDGKVEPNLEVVGQLLEVLLQSRGFIKLNFNEIIAHVVSISGPDPHRLVRMLASIFPARPTSHDILNFDDSILADVHGCLDNYINAQKLQDLDACARISTQIRSLLDFDHTKRLNSGRNEHLRGIESICSLRCQKCGIVFLLRLNLWSQPGKNACVYRIPGLRYDTTAPDSVGLIIEDNRIIGRTTSVVRMCDCHELCRVLIV